MKNLSKKWRLRTLLRPAPKPNRSSAKLSWKPVHKMSTSVNKFSTFRECFVIRSLLVKILYNTCKAKRGRRPRVRSTPIDNTYVQVNNECSLLCYRSSKSCPTWRLPVSIADPASMPIFVFPNIEPEHSVLHKTFLKVSRVVCYSFIPYLNSLKYFSEIKTCKKKINGRKLNISFASCIKKAK